MLAKAKLAKAKLAKAKLGKATLAKAKLAKARLATDKLCASPLVSFATLCPLFRPCFAIPSPPSWAAHREATLDRPTKGVLLFRPE